jgi:nicotinamide-nucleotide amidase
VAGLIQEAEAGLRARLGDAVFGADSESLQEATARLLIERGLTLAIAESCTGGLVASRLTEAPGSSAFLKAGFVSYSNEAKTRDLGVPPALILEHGAVSAEVAQALAAGACRQAATDIGLAITGIAGPTGATATKPVGLVYLAIAMDAGVRTEELRFGSGLGRQVIRHLAAQAAINLLRLTLVRR